MVKVTVSRSRELQCPEADLVECLVIDTEGLVRVLDKLMNGEGGVVGFNNGIGHQWRGNDGKCAHHSVGVFLTDLRDNKGTHTSTSSTTERVGDLETCDQNNSACTRVFKTDELTLKTVSGFSFLSHDIKNGVDEFSTLGVIYVFVQNLLLIVK